MALDVGLSIRKRKEKEENKLVDENERCGVLRRAKTNLKRPSSRTEPPLIVIALLRSSLEAVEVSGVDLAKHERNGARSTSQFKIKKNT